MDWLENHWLQLLFIFCYLCLIAYHGWVGQKKSRSLGDFLVGGRSLGGVVIALSSFATFVSSVTFVGHAGRSYALGPSWWMTCVVIFTALVFVAWFVVAPPFIKQVRKYGSLTVADFLEYRYQSRLLSRLAGIVIVAASIAYMVAVYVGAARLLESLLDLNSFTIMIVIFVVVTAYTLTGGFHSIVATDSVQGLILFCGAMILPAAMIWHKGGIGPLVEDARIANPQALEWSGQMPLFAMVGLALGVALKFLVEPRQLSRFFGLAWIEQLRPGRWLVLTMMFLTYLFMLPVGFLAHAFIPENTIQETDEVVPFLLGSHDLLGPVASAFFLTALAAAAMSSLDSVLLVASSSIDHDLISPDREHRLAMRHSRFWVLILSATAAGLALLALRHDFGIVAISSFSGSVFAAAFLPCLIVGVFWSQATRTGALVSLLLGFATTTFWFFAKPADSWLHEVFLGLGISLLTFFGVSSLTKKGTSPAHSEVATEEGNPKP